MTTELPPPTKRRKTGDVASRESASAWTTASDADRSSINSLALRCIDTAWPEVGNFLNLTDHVRLSKTCRTLRGLVIIDGKIGLRRFRCYNVQTDVDDDEFYLEPEPDATPNHLFQALRAIHFPTLHGILVESPGDGLPRTDFVSAAPIPIIACLAENISVARNLEKLDLELRVLGLEGESNAELESYFDQFGRGLASCHKLRSLSVDARVDCKTGRGVRHSNGMLRALAPAIRTNTNSLKEIDLNFNWKPIVKDLTMASELFRAIVSASNMERLALRFDRKDYFLALTDAIKESSKPLPRLKHIDFKYTGRRYQEEREPVSGLEEVLGLFKGDLLEKVEILVDASCWAGMRDCPTVLTDFFLGCPGIKEISMNFGYAKSCDDTTRNAIGDAIASFAMQDVRRWSKSHTFNMRGHNMSFSEETAQRIKDFLRAHNIGFTLIGLEPWNKGDHFNFSFPTQTEAELRDLVRRSMAADENRKATRERLRMLAKR